MDGAKTQTLKAR